MTRFAQDPVAVPLPGGCRCTGSPHEQDEVYLLPRLTFEGGDAATKVINEHAGSGDTEGVGLALCRVYLRHQVKGWNLLEDDGRPMPWSPEVLETDWESAKAVTDVADDLYSEVLLAPLLAAVSTFSPAGPTAASTSPGTPSSSRRRKR